MKLQVKFLQWRTFTGSPVNTNFKKNYNIYVTEHNEHVSELHAIEVYMNINTICTLLDVHVPVHSSSSDFNEIDIDHQ